MRTFLPAASLSSRLRRRPGRRGDPQFRRHRLRQGSASTARSRFALTTGVAPFASASGSAAALDRVAIDVQGRTLVVHSNRSSWGGYPGEATGPVEISIGTHELSAAWLNGSGSLADRQGARA